jgi:VanZ family protein
MTTGRNLYYWLPALSWMGVIFYMSSRTGVPGPSWLSIPGHLVEYAVLALLYRWALIKTTALSPTASAYLAVALAVVYGITDEWHQSFVPGRVPDPLDVVVDFLGAATAVFIAGRIEKSKGKTGYS